MKYLGYIFFRSLVIIVSVIPFRLLYLISDGCAFLIHHVFRYRKRVICNNLKNAFPNKGKRELKSITKQFYKSLSDVILESIKGYSCNPDKLKERYQFKNIELANNYYEKGQTIIVALSHYGNWEWGAHVAGLVYKHDLFSFYKPMSNKYIDKFVFEKRKEQGMKLVSVYNPQSVFRTGDGKARAYFMISDQHPGNIRKAVWVKFLNQDTPCLRGIEEYSRIFNLPVIYIDIQRVKRGFYTLEMSEICSDPSTLSKGEITGKYMEKLESQVIKKPEDWLWSHLRWRNEKPL
jgi:Kdo2-lipid IVA lauroyltransferase/acyltransferase